MTFIGHLQCSGHCVAVEEPVLVLVPSKADPETRSKMQFILEKGSTSEGMRKEREKEEKPVMGALMSNLLLWATRVQSP